MFHDKELFTVCPNRHPARTTSPSLDDLPIKASRDRSAVSHTIPNDLLDSSGGSPALTARHTDAEDGPSAAHAHIDFSKVPPADPALHTRRKSGLPARPRWYARWVGTGVSPLTRSSICDMSTPTPRGAVCAGLTCRCLFFARRKESVQGGTI